MRKLPPLASLRAFEAVARYMSFKKAAAELGVTSTAISHQIRLLEDTCGQPLLRRRPPPLRLTNAGERLFPVLRNGLDAFAAAVGSLSTPAAHSTLRVTSTSAFASRWLIPRLPRWKAAYPDVQLEVIGTDALVDLRKGEADVAIRFARMMPMNFVVHELFRDNFLPVCSPKLPPNGAVKRPTELLQHPLIHFDWMSPHPEAPTWSRWLAVARTVDPDLPDIHKPWDLSFREEVHAIDAVVAGQGIAVCSDVIVSHELKTGVLVKAHDLSLPGYGFYIVYVPGHVKTPMIEAFSGWMKSVV
jgi:LysR family glycine cleavage system transcriptional activator